MDSQQTAFVTGSLIGTALGAGFVGLIVAMLTGLVPRGDDRKLSGSLVAALVLGCLAIRDLVTGDAVTAAGIAIAVLFFLAYSFQTRGK